MAAMRKHSSTGIVLIATILVGIWVGYCFMGNYPVQAKPKGDPPHGGPIDELQRQVRNLQIDHDEQEADLEALAARVEALEGCGCGEEPPPPPPSPDGDLDQDEDGFTPNQGDCDDDDFFVNPGAMEIVGDGIDNDCDATIDEAP